LAADSSIFNSFTRFLLTRFAHGFALIAALVQPSARPDALKDFSFYDFKTTTNGISENSFEWQEF
jgi:hypothetical protein